MGSSADPPPISPELLKHSRFSSLLKSWFCRFYEHLFSLVLLNLGWFLCLLALVGLAWRLGLLGDASRLNLLGFYGVFLVLAFISIGWAYLIFKIFNEDHWTWGDFLGGTQRFFLKAMTLSAVMGILLLLVLFNAYFYFHLQSHHRFIDLVLMGLMFWAGLFGLSTWLYQWPILFFQDPPLLKVFYRSALISLSGGGLSLALLALFGVCVVLFSITVVPWFFFGFVFFFSMQCVALEKLLLRYKITYGDQPLEPFLEQLDREQARGWRDFLRPWENR